MSTHESLKRFPSLLNENRWAANGTAPDGKFIGLAGNALNHCVAYRRKLVAEYAFDSNDIPAGVASAPANVFYFGFHSGVGADRLVGVFNLAPPSSSGSDPYVTIAVTDGYSGGSTTESAPELHYGGLSSAWADAPDYISWGHTTEVSITPDTDYRVAVRLYDYARVLSFCLYEVGLTTVDTTKDGVDPRVGVGSPVYDADVQQYVESASEQWRHNAGTIFTAAFFYNGTTDWRIAATNKTTAVNIYDLTSSTVSATSYGFKVNLLYHNSVNQTAVPCVLAVYADADSTDADNQVIVKDSSGDIISVTNIASGGPAWYTSTGTISATDDHKIDIHVKTGASDTVTIYSVCLYELD